MSDAAPADRIAAAAAYEALHVPALFQYWTGPVLDAAQVRRGDRVLDVACGTGVLARAALTRVGAEGHVAGLDADPGMLEVARRQSPGIDWRSGVAETLPFTDAQFDIVVSQFGMMFFPDRTAAIREMTRVLATGGRLAVAVWDALERSPAYAIEVGLLARLAGPAAADALRAPFVLGNPEALARLFHAAGVESATVTRHVGRARFPSIRAMVEADLRGWLPVMGIVLDESLIRRLLDEAERALERYVDGYGAVTFEAPALLVAVTAPS